jgi:hypothetical protein
MRIIALEVIARARDSQTPLVFLEAVLASDLV